jgi:hypothetical protein
VQSKGELKPTDFFSPSNNAELDEKDLDLGSAAPIALPSPYFGTEAVPNLLVQASKTGELYLLNRSNLGGMKQGPGETDLVVREQGLGTYGGVWDGSALWPGDGGYVYIPAVAEPLKGSENFDYLRYFKYEVEKGLPRLSSAAKSVDQFGFGSGSPIVTSNGVSNGSAVVWIPRCPPSSETTHCEKAELFAYPAVPSTEALTPLWKAPIGWASKFSRPDASSGHVYVGNREGELFSFSGHVLTPSTASLEFGTVPVGGQRASEVTFTNSGTPLEVSAVRAPSAPFEATGLPAKGTVIAPGQAITVQVKFSPVAAGKFAGSLGLATQAGETTVALSGSTPEPSAAPVPPTGGVAQTASALLTSAGGFGTVNATTEPLALRNLKLHLLSSKPGHHRRAKVSYTLTASGKVKLVLYRRVISHRCKGGVRTCVRYMRTKLSYTVTGHAGRNVLTLDLGRLRAGDYRLTATPIARSGATVARSVAFRIR